MHEVETVVPGRRQARRSDKHIADQLEPLYWQVETLITHDFKLKMRQRHQRLVKHDAQPSEVTGEFRGSVTQQVKGTECLKSMQRINLYAGASLKTYRP